MQRYSGRIISANVKSRYNSRVGLRESKKLLMRQVIADEAMRLFATRGFDHVTVAEVAAAAGVSDKTVFNYFPTKEDLFFDEVPRREAALVEAISGRAHTPVGPFFRISLRLRGGAALKTTAPR